MTIHPHPTLSETVMESAEVFFGTSTRHLPPEAGMSAAFPDARFAAAAFDTMNHTSSGNDVIRPRTSGWRTSCPHSLRRTSLFLSLCLVCCSVRHGAIAAERRAAVFHHNQHADYAQRSSGPHHSLRLRARISASGAVRQLQHRRAIPADEPRAPPVRRRATGQPTQCSAEQLPHSAGESGASPSRKEFRRKAFRWAAKNWAPCRPAMWKPTSNWCACPIRARARSG